MSQRDPTGDSITSRSNATLGLALLLGTGVLWGTIGVASKGITLESSFDAVSISWLRAVIASPVCLLAGWMVLGKRLFAMTRRDFGVMVLLGVALVVYQWLYLAAIDRLGVSAATLISLCGAPVIVAVVSTLALREPLTGVVGLALIGALAGTILLVGSPETGSGRETAVGVLLAVGSAIGIASHVMGCRSIARRTHPVQPLAIGFPVGAIVFAPVALLRGVSFNQPAEAWLLLLYLGIVPSSIAYFLYQRGLQDVPATMASIVTMIEPLIAGLLAWYFFDERLGLWGLLGGALLLGSIGLLTMQSRRLVPRTAPAPEGAVTP
jgi:drug/metabolite transporter, DME family